MSILRKSPPTPPNPKPVPIQFPLSGNIGEQNLKDRVIAQLPSPVGAVVDAVIGVQAYENKGAGELVRNIVNGIGFADEGFAGLTGQNQHMMDVLSYQGVTTGESHRVNWT